jgi:hypothetical protein
MSTHAPKLLKEAGRRLFDRAPTVSALGADAGDERAESGDTCGSGWVGANASLGEGAEHISATARMLVLDESTLRAVAQQVPELLGDEGREGVEEE